MKYSAVIFDMFGTIIPDIDGSPYREIARRMADALSVPQDDFVEMWFSLSYERNAGIFETVQDNIRYICEKLEWPADVADITRAHEIRYEFVQKTMLSPRDGAPETIRKLKESGLKVGLLSDCSPTEPVIWRDTLFVPLFDATVFSALANCKKPDPRIFEMAVEALGVEPADCVYVGNGGSNELEGAFKAGMLPVLILPEEGEAHYTQPKEEVREFASKNGRVIEHLSEVLDIVRE